MTVFSFKATWNHDTQEGKIALTGFTPPSMTLNTQVVEPLTASEMSALIAILRISEAHVEYSDGVLTMSEVNAGH